MHLPEAPRFDEGSRPRPSTTPLAPPRRSLPITVTRPHNQPRHVPEEPSMNEDEAQDQVRDMIREVREQSTAKRARRVVHHDEDDE
eukprot:scaffold426486_cov48-Prasinocladus_malaysianus.AAC.3